MVSPLDNTHQLLSHLAYRDIDGLAHDLIRYARGYAGNSQLVYRVPERDVEEQNRAKNLGALEANVVAARGNGMKTFVFTAVTRITNKYK